MLRNGYRIKSGKPALPATLRQSRPDITPKSPQFGKARPH